jgi:hypothetical protein
VVPALQRSGAAGAKFGEIDEIGSRRFRPLDAGGVKP